MTVCLLMSGGADSIALCYWLRPSLALTVDYGQLAAKAEIAASRQVCGDLGVPHTVVKIDCSQIGAGCMITRPTSDIGLSPSLEWWPFRNQLLITFAASVCVAREMTEVIIGTVASDVVHADGRESFVKSVDSLVAMQEGAIRVSAPAIGMTSAELARTSRVPNSLLSWAHSCHRGNLACGRCRGCNKLLALFSELGFSCG